jgi:hypothetical protein
MLHHRCSHIRAHKDIILFFQEPTRQEANMTGVYNRLYVDHTHLVYRISWSVRYTGCPYVT